MAGSINRHLTVLPRGNGKTYLSWRLLRDDAKDEPFQVERSRDGNKWAQVSEAVVTTSTGFSDETPELACYQYRVIDGSNHVSEAVEVDSGADPSNLSIQFPLRYKPEQFPTRMATGDLTNDGRYGLVIVESENGIIQVCAYDHDGGHLWNYDAKLPSRGGCDGRTWLFHPGFDAVAIPIPVVPYPFPQ